LQLQQLSDGTLNLLLTLPDPNKIRNAFFYLHFTRILDRAIFEASEQCQP